MTTKRFGIILTIRSVSLLLGRSRVVITPLRRRALGRRRSSPPLIGAGTGGGTVPSVTLLLRRGAPTLIALHHVGPHGSAQVHRWSPHLPVGSLYHPHGSLGRSPRGGRIRTTHFVPPGTVTGFRFLDLHLATKIMIPRSSSLRLHYIYLFPVEVDKML